MAVCVMKNVPARRRMATEDEEGKKRNDERIFFSCVALPFAIDPKSMGKRKAEKSTQVSFSRILN